MKMSSMKYIFYWLFTLITTSQSITENTNWMPVLTVFVYSSFHNYANIQRVNEATTFAFSSVFILLLWLILYEHSTLPTAFFPSHLYYKMVECRFENTTSKLPRSLHIWPTKNPPTLSIIQVTCSPDCISVPPTLPSPIELATQMKLFCIFAPIYFWASQKCYNISLFANIAMWHNFAWIFPFFVLTTTLPAWHLYCSQ